MDSIKKETGDKREFSTGAEKQAAAGKGTPVLFPGDAYIEVCKHFEAGAEHYEARNWEQGIPLGELINSLERHIADEKMGDTSERHDRAIGWNAIVYLATKLRIQNGILPKTLDDMPRYPRRSSCLTVDEVEEIKNGCGIRENGAGNIIREPDHMQKVVDANKAMNAVLKDDCDCPPHGVCSRCITNDDLLKPFEPAIPAFEPHPGRLPGRGMDCTHHKPTKRIYMSHSIRGRAGVGATIEDMELNNLLAIEAGEKLKKLMPDYDVYVPGSHDELVIIGFEMGILDEEKILAIDCKIVEKCDMIVAYTPDGYLSRGMTTELNHAIQYNRNTIETPMPLKCIRIFDGSNQPYDLLRFRGEYPQEHKKLK